MHSSLSCLTLSTVYHYLWMITWLPQWQTCDINQAQWSGSVLELQTLTQSALATTPKEDKIKGNHFMVHYNSTWKAFQRTWSLCLYNNSALSLYSLVSDDLFKKWFHIQYKKRSWKKGVIQKQEDFLTVFIVRGQLWHRVCTRGERTKQASFNTHFKGHSRVTS